MRFRPRLEGLEARDNPSGPDFLDPTDPGSGGGGGPPPPPPPPDDPGDVHLVDPNEGYNGTNTTP